MALILTGCTSTSATPADKAACITLKEYSIAVGVFTGPPTPRQDPRLYSDLRNAARQATDPVIRSVAQVLAAGAVPTHDEGTSATRRCHAVGVDTGATTPASPGSTA